MSTVVVTGAGRGIGAAIASEASRRGWLVGVLDRDPEAAETVARRLERAVPLTADVTDEESLQIALDRLGELHAFVNNAGIVRFGPLAELPADDWRAVVDVNLTGTFLAGRAAALRMPDGGAIVNISSINGMVPAARSGAYGAAKAGVALLTQQMAVEWAERGLRVNAVAPGFIDAGMSEPIYADPVARRVRSSGVPLGRLGDASDVAAVALFLLSSEARYVTGQTIAVDGGVGMNVLGLLPRPVTVDAPDAGNGNRRTPRADRGAGDPDG